MGIAAVGSAIDTFNHVLVSSEGLNKMIQLFKSIIDGLVLHNNADAEPLLSLRDRCRSASRLISGIIYLPKSVEDLLTRDPQGNFQIVQDSLVRITNKLSLLVASVCQTLSLAKEIAPIKFDQFAAFLIGKLSTFSLCCTNVSLYNVGSLAGAVAYSCELLESARRFSDPVNPDPVGAGITMINSAAKILLILLLQICELNYLIVALSILSGLLSITSIVLYG